MVPDCASIRMYRCRTRLGQVRGASEQTPIAACASLSLIPPLQLLSQNSDFPATDCEHTNYKLQIILLLLGIPSFHPLVFSHNDISLLLLFGFARVLRDTLVPRAIKDSR
jgi:hypothetical protein